MILNIHERIALTDLVHAYAAAIDDRRFDDAAELFTDTAQLKLPEPPESLEPIRDHAGRDAIRSALDQVAAVPRTEHEIIGEVYSADTANGATGRVACIAHHWSPPGDEFTDLI